VASGQGIAQLKLARWKRLGVPSGNTRLDAGRCPLWESKADISGLCGYVGFSPDHDRKSGPRVCQLSANSCREQVQHTTRSLTCRRSPIAVSGSAIRGLLALHQLTQTYWVLRIPIRCAAPPARSRRTPIWYARPHGPESLIRTTTDWPLAGLVTVRLVPIGHVRAAAVLPCRFARHAPPPNPSRAT
jgi:hypothetical protein